jgi:asparagine synthase (glutamine-hydrolysing)
MSAIVGILDRGGAPTDAATLDDMVSRMRFWGPGGIGCWREGPVGLARLAHDASPEPGAPGPLHHASGDLVLAADARLDNRPELFDALGVERARRAGMTDPELILAAVERWGDGAPEHLVGEFAYAVWSRSRRRLFCARDHYGARPLYHHSSPRVFAFASAIKALWAVPGIDRGLDDGSVADYLVGLHAPGEGTFYRAVRRLAAGHSLSVTTERLAVARHWRLEHVPAVRLRSDDEYAEAFRATFALAVRGRLRTDHGVAVSLSGGLDSTAVAAVAARQLAARGRRLEAFHAVPAEGAAYPVPSGWVADEMPYLRALQAIHPNLEIHREPASGRTPLSDLDASFWRHDRPTRAVGNRHWIESILEAARSRGVGVLLTGQFGNGTLSWSGAGVLANLAAGGRWLALARELRARCRGPRSVLWSLRTEVIAPLLPVRLRLAAGDLRRGAPFWAGSSLIHPDLARRTDLVERFSSRGMDPASRPLPDSRAQRRRNLAEEPGEIWASSGAAFGLHVSDPTADRRLIEFCLSIPDDQFLRLGESRRLVRHAMRGEVPDAILRRTDRGLQAPDRFARLGDPVAALRREADRIGRSALVRECLDLALVRRLLDEAAALGPRDPQQVATLSRVLQGIVVGRFLVWHERGSPAPT